MVLDKVMFDKLHSFSENICQNFNIKEPKDRNHLLSILIHYKKVLILEK